MILVGLVGILVPVMPGWTPLLVGLALLFPDTRLVRWLRRRIRRMMARGRLRRMRKARGRR